MKIVLTIVLLFVAAALAVTAFASWVVYERRFTFPQTVLLLLSKLLVRYQWRTTLARDFPVPPDQGAIIVSNHRSSIDPFFVQACLNRPVYWMVAREYVEHPMFGWFLKTCAVIPVNRGGIDTAATKSAIRTVEAGSLIGMFPEGRINVSDNFHDASSPRRGACRAKSWSGDGAVLHRRITLSQYGLEPLFHASESASPLRATDRATTPSERRSTTIERIHGSSRSSHRGTGWCERFSTGVCGPAWKPTESELAETLSSQPDQRSSQA